MIYNEDPSHTVDIRVATYNVLAQGLVSRKMFPYCSKLALRWSSRKHRLFEEILRADADVLSLQEVDKTQIPEWDVFLTTHGYKYVYCCKQADRAIHGLIIAYKADKYDSLGSHELHYANMCGYSQSIHEQFDVSKQNIALFCM